MMYKGPVLFLVFLLGAAAVYAQSSTAEENLKTGIAFYREGRFTEALVFFGLLKPGEGPYAEALYWSSLAELSEGNYDKSLLSLEKLEKTGPGRWTAELPYHRGRCLFYSDRYEEALKSFTSYGASLSEGDPRKALAYYWMGESLFGLGRLDNAADAFSAVVDKYPSSVKYEAASYRLSLINQKKAENELLGILTWSHEESLKSMEEYRSREKTYEEAIADYQRQLAGMPPAESSGLGEYRDALALAELRIAALEASLAETGAALEELRKTGRAPAERSMANTEKTLRILELKAAVFRLNSQLTERLHGEK